MFFPQSPKVPKLDQKPLKTRQDPRPHLSTSLFWLTFIGRVKCMLPRARTTSSTTECELNLDLFVRV